MAKSEVKMCK